MSTAIPSLIVIALLAAIALCAAGIWAAIEVAKTARSSRQLAEDLDVRVPPLADKLDVTVDAFNAELLRVDLMVDQLEGAVDSISGTAETVREVVDAPMHLVNEVAERVRHGFRRRGARRPAAQPESGDGQQAQVVLLPAAEADDQPSVISAALDSEGVGLDLDAPPEHYTVVSDIEPEVTEPPAIAEIEPSDVNVSESVVSSNPDSEEA